MPDPSPPPDRRAASAAGKAAGQVACPFCASTETELFALFGQFLLASPYYCRNCHTVFDVVRWTETAPGEDGSS